VVNDLTAIFEAMANGDQQAHQHLFMLVYNELRSLAAAQLAREQPGHTLQPTALVHEAYVRLAGNSSNPLWQNRAHFFAAAAEAMRRVLIDAARKKHAKKRGHGHQRLERELGDIADGEASAEIVALDHAVCRLEERDPLGAQLAKLRFYAGLSIVDAAEVLSISVPAANRRWAKTKAWLHRELTTD
jgi:RNA polymerase sigma factor (TIGR02999 family)